MNYTGTKKMLSPANENIHSPCTFDRRIRFRCACLSIRFQFCLIAKIRLMNTMEKWKFPLLMHGVIWKNWDMMERFWLLMCTQLLKIHKEWVLPLAALKKNLCLCACVIRNNFLQRRVIPYFKNFHFLFKHLFYSFINDYHLLMNKCIF